MPVTQWTGSLHQTFRLLPTDRMSANLRPFLESDGLTEAQILPRLPYDRARAVQGAGPNPDPKRYRDGRQVYQTAGLLYEADDGRIRITELGRAVLRWTTIITPNNCTILARHAAYGLSACQLRNPSDSGAKYDASMVVFPCQFIWRAMLMLDGRVSSDELNRGILNVQNAEHLVEVVGRIADARSTGNPTAIGDEVVSGSKKNDRIIPWMALASFGWTLFPDKQGGYYQLSPRTLDIVKEASRIQRKHREFSSMREYVEYISRCAALPKDIR